MNDWTTHLQLISRLPGVMVWILLLASAFVFLQKRPGPAAFALLGGAVIALLGICFSVVCETMFHSAVRGAGAGSGEVSKWMMVLAMSHWAYLAGALTFSISLLIGLFAVFRGDAA